ncbi:MULTISPECIES: PA3611 family quorum-sensing-regulated virulence factor [Pseudomonas]|uniref:Quorum-sensing-regulated virulence factor n=1 Tax=Serpens gallinarum TaxID=2763075 RepID=A0ABR8TSB9_9PSED|nr:MULTISPECIES: PA3611 family quorum-sensing-regulated virulence factor [Pseudomonas]MBD7978194.1 hypothetical protein [Serpens gallinarum]MBF0676374.1 hypothetical protein [Pseudomonas sp.]
MSRLLAMLLCFAMPWAQAESLRSEQLSRDLQRIARESSVGTPRAINADLLDRGFSVEGHELINHLGVQPRHAEEMRRNPEAVREQLSQSVCNNAGFKRLLDQGATLRYQFTEYPNGEPISSQRFQATDCP